MDVLTPITNADALLGSRIKHGGAKHEAGGNASFANTHNESDWSIENRLGRNQN